MYNKFGFGNCCNVGFGHCCNNGQAEFYHGDAVTRLGIHELKRGIIDVERGLREMEKGFFDSTCNKPCGCFNTFAFGGLQHQGINKCGCDNELFW